MIFFTSDLHFGHRNIISAAQRPFASSEEMDAALIKNWNRRIRPNDEIYILGDFTMQGPQFAMEILRQLNGRKYLVRGNHDQFVDRISFDRSLFEWIRDYYSLPWQKQQFILFHYPIAEWDRSHYGSIHLHGHQHNKPEYNAANAAQGLLRYDVGVEANDMAPVSIDEVLNFFGITI